MKNNKIKIEDLRITTKALFSGELSFDDLQAEIDEHRKEKLFRISKSMPNPIAEIPEENKLIILIDIVGFSKRSTREQVYNIYLFQRYIISQVLTNRLGSFTKKIHIQNFIPTGDGCYIVADECTPENALSFLVALVGGFKEIQDENGNTLSLRASALIGSCVPFIDLAKHINYVGEGMNEAARILSYGQKALEDQYMEKHPDAEILDSKKYSRNSLYLGESLFFKLEDYQEDCNEIIRFSDIPDKHGKTRNIAILQGIWNS